jgi:hypothetical protein
LVTMLFPDDPYRLAPRYWLRRVRGNGSGVRRGRDIHRRGDARVNDEDNVLHLILGLTGILAGLATRKASAPASPAPAT